MSLFRGSRPGEPPVTAVLTDDGLISSLPVTGYAWPAGLTEGHNGQVTGWLCLGTVDGADAYFKATETKALTRLIQAAWDLRRQMFLARLKGRHAMWGAKP